MASNALKDEICCFVKDNPGCHYGDIKTALGLGYYPAEPVHELIQEGRIEHRGFPKAQAKNANLFITWQEAQDQGILK